MRKRLELTVSEFLRIWTPEKKFYLFEAVGTPLPYDFYREKFSSQIPAGLKIVVWEEIDTESINIDAKAIGRKVADSGWEIDNIEHDTRQTTVWVHNGLTNRQLFFDHGDKIEVRK